MITVENCARCGELEQVAELGELEYTSMADNVSRICAGCAQWEASFELWSAVLKIGADLPACSEGRTLPRAVRLLAFNTRNNKIDFMEF